MSFPFRIVEHNIPGQHIREYPNSTRKSVKQETPLQLAIKQYIPKDLPSPVPDNAITIIGGPGNGTQKEIYEPLWEDLYAELKHKQIPLRAIWVADMSNQGSSGVLNEHILGDQINWYDHSRDLLHMVNHFRDEIPRPIIGVAHSMGCAQMVNLSIIHPRLLSTLILIEPVILGESMAGGPNPGIIASRRRDIWPSPEKARESLTKSLKMWDPRARERYITHSLRSVPTALYDPADPNVGEHPVTLTTTKHQEAWSFTTPNLEPESLDRLLLADWHPEWERHYLFSRPECWSAMRNLPYLRPSVKWIFGAKSYLSKPSAQDSKMQVTGTGVGGSGGAPAGAVEKAVLPEGEHFLCFQQIGWCADVAGEWIERWFQGWLEDEKFWANYSSRNSDKDGLRISEDGMMVMRARSGTKREDFPLKGKL